MAVAVVVVVKCEEVSQKSATLLAVAALILADLF